MKAGAAGGIGAIVKVINTYIDSADVCEKGYGALWSMTVNNGKMTDKTIDRTKWNKQLRTK